MCVQLIATVNFLLNTLAQSVDILFKYYILVILNMIIYIKYIFKLNYNILNIIIFNYIKYILKHMYEQLKIQRNVVYVPS